MNIEFADLGHLSLAYETFGNRNNPAVFLVMGLGAQMIVWPDELCHFIADNGYFLVRFDNRDIGQSSKLDHAKPAGLLLNVLRLRMGLPVRAPYSLYDMAKDVVALMDFLKLAKAHLVGASMGGMICQIVAAKYYDRVLSLTSIMSSSGNLGNTPPSPRVLLHMLKPANKRDHLAFIEHKVELITRLSGKNMQTERHLILSRVTKAMERSCDDDLGTKRQTAAILSTGCRKQELRELRVPTLIIHGNEDPLIPLNYGISTARIIKHAQIEVMAGMGHDFPAVLVKPLAQRIIKHFETATKSIAKKRDAKRPFLF